MSKANDPDKKVFDEHFSRRIIYLISLGSLAGMGIWMILDPGGVEHSSIEKGTVYIFKELWSLEFGIIALTIATIELLLTIMKMITMSSSAWYRDESGYYLYVNKERSSGNHSTYQGKDLMVFHPDSSKVFKLKNYQKAKHNKFYKAIPS